MTFAHPNTVVYKTTRSQLPEGLMHSPYLDETVMLQAPQTIVEAEDHYPRLANLCELVNTVNLHAGRPQTDFSFIPLGCPTEDEGFFSDHLRCQCIESELAEYLEWFLPPWARIRNETDRIAIEPDTEAAVQDLINDGSNAVYDLDDPATPDQPDLHYRGCWLAWSHTQGAALYMRLDFGAGYKDHLMWTLEQTASANHPATAEAGAANDACTSYTVTWSIDVEAHTPEEAAEQALMIQRDRDSEATYFEVRHNASGARHEVDLGED